MTGYSSVRETIGKANVLLEIKALNHKGMDVHFHAPRSLAMLEVPIREYVQQQLRRGRIEIYLRGDGILPPEEIVRPCPDVAQKYLQAAQTIAQALNLEFKPKLEWFLTLDGVLEIEEEDRPTEEYWNLLKGLVERAIAGVAAMKVSEGGRLEEELRSVLDRIDRLNQEIQARRELVLREYRDKMLERISEWGKSIDLEPNRVLQEVAFYADRSDIQEEVVRLKSHIQQFRDTLEENQSGDSYRPVGRNLDFLCQEMFREVNTIGSKSASLEIVRRVLELKSAVDQLREQVQNVE